MSDMPQVALGRPATYEDLVAVADNLVAEIVDGELWTSPRPAPRHARSYARLVGLLEPPFDRGHGGPGGWVILAEPELHLAGDVLVPDLAGWRRERMPRLPDTAYFSLAPDWVCEILSPSTGVLDRTRKLRIYAREGVRHAWLVDPAMRMIEVLALDAAGAGSAGGTAAATPEPGSAPRRWVVVDTFGANQLERIEPFDAIELELGLLWEDGTTTSQP
jgi:Uma2 family endonuclease